MSCSGGTGSFSVLLSAAQSRRHPPHLWGSDASWPATALMTTVECGEVQLCATIQAGLMLQRDYSSVLGVKNLDEFRAEVVRLTRGLGFDTFTAMAVTDRGPANPEFVYVHNAPAGYLATHEDLSTGKQDPVMQHCKISGLPMIWDQATYVKAGQGAKWEHQASYGYRCGIVFAMHMPKGRHFMIGVDRDQSLPESIAERTRFIAELQLFAVHAQDAAMRVLWSKPRSPENLASLTPREIECLHWTLEGKTAGELGRILGIAEDTAVHHTRNASRKLQWVNKHQAVVKAVRLNLID